MNRKVKLEWGRTKLKAEHKTLVYEKERKAPRRNDQVQKQRYLIT